VGTSVGWNTRQPAHRAPDLCSLTGSYFPLPPTRAERLASGDPRLSLEERYGTHQGFVDAVRKAAGELVAERFLLQEDAQAAIATFSIIDWGPGM
jgi:hypothetical protein